MLTTTESSAYDNLEDAAVDTGGQSEYVACVELPAGIEVGVYCNDELVLLDADRVKVLEGPP